MEKINRRVYLRLTNKCNRECKLCYYANDPKPIGNMELGTLENIINNELQMHEDNKYLRVVLSGGEPTLYPDLARAIDYLNNISLIRIVLETNATNVTKLDFIELLKYFKHKHFLKIAVYTELFEADPSAKQNLIDFIRLAQSSGIRYILNPRYVDEADKQNLQTFIQENHLEPTFGQTYYYAFQNYNLYRDGTLPLYDFSFISYDYDGSVLLWHQSESRVDDDYVESQNS